MTEPGQSQKSILTGDRPTGPLHLGHFVGSLQNRVKLQHEYKTVKSEVMFRSKQSELVKAVEPLGLKELVASPVVLKESGVETAK